MNTIKSVLEAISTDENLRDELSIVYSLSQPMLTESDGVLSVKLFIYQSMPSEDNSEVCYGEIICGLNEETVPQAVFKKIEDNKKDVLNNIINIETYKMDSMKDRKRAEQTVIESLDKIIGFYFKDAADINENEQETVRQYLSALKSISSKKMQSIYYSVNPSFYDWCANAIK
jgi:hypothetical protein